MGYSITQEKHDRLQALKRDGRLCQVAREHVTKATVRQTHESWDYESDKQAGKAPTTRTFVVCPKHAREFPVGYEGRNFRVTAEERF